MSGSVVVYREDEDVVFHFGGILCMKRFPVEEWIRVQRGDFRGNVPGSWRVPREELEGLKPIRRSEALRLRRVRARQGSLRSVEFRRRVDAAAERLGLYPGSGIAQMLVEGSITEEQARWRARRVLDRHHRTRYNELLVQGYSKEDAKRMADEELAWKRGYHEP